MSSLEISVKLNGHKYSAVLSRGPEDKRTSVSLYEDDIWAGNGYLDRYSAEIISTTDWGKDVYTALNDEIDDTLSRGVGAEVDPRGESEE